MTVTTELGPLTRRCVTRQLASTSARAITDGATGTGCLSSFERRHNVAVRPWLEALRARLQNNRGRRSSETVRRLGSHREIQNLEDRTLLASTVLLAGSELKILSDADESIIVQEDPANSEHIEVLVNGSPSTAVGVLRADAITTLTVLTGDEDNSVDLADVDAAVFMNLTTITIATGNGDDTIIGSPDIAMAVDAGDGEDTVTAFAGLDTIIAGDGDDVILGGEGADFIDAGNGDDVVLGEAGDDTILGDDGSDTISGGDGDDSLIGHDGNDAISGDAGSDTVFADLGDDLVDGGNGADRIFGGAGKDTVDGSGGDDTIFGNGGIDSLNGGDDQDSIRGGASNDEIHGDAGNDLLLGDAGNDTLRGGDGDDTAYGAGGDDDIDGQLGNDALFGNSGNDSVCGGRGSDSLEGDAGNDLIRSICETITPVGISVGDANVAEGGVPDVAIVVDRSFSSLFQFAGTSVGDINGDGLSNTILDAELSSLLTFQQDLITRGVTANLSVIPFAADSVVLDMDPATAGVQTTTTPTADTDGNGVADFEQVVRSIQSGFQFFGTNFEAPLQDAITVFQGLGTGPGLGSLIFLSDGDPFGSGVYTDEVATLQGLGIDLRAFGVGAGASLPALQIIDPGAQIVNTSQDLAVALTNIAVTGGDASVPVALSVAPPVSFTVDVVTSDGTAVAGADYVPVNQTLTFLAGQATATLNVSVAGDATVEGVETFFITLSNLQVQSPTITPFVLIDPVGQINIFDQGTAVPPNPPLPPPVTLPEVIRGLDPDPDTMFGGTGDDTLISDAGADLVVGDLGNDSILGGLNNDTLLGGGGHDTLEGEEGDDSILGNGGHDSLDGGVGEDLLVWRGTGDGNDTVSGGSGGDVVEVRGDSTGNIFGIAQTTEGRLRVEEGPSVLTVDFDVKNMEVNAGTGDDLVTVGDVSQVVLSTLTLNGDAGNDTLTAAGSTPGSVRMARNGGAGMDSVFGGDGAETLSGGDDDDVLAGGGGNDILNGDNGADAISGDDGDDTIAGGDGNDVVSAGNGNDSVSGGAGNDTVDGGSGDDTLRGQFGDDSLIGSFGADSIDGGLGSDDLIGAAGDDTLDGGRNNDVIIGNSGNDILLGNHGNDFIRGNGGSDEIVAGDGDDTVFAGDGEDGVDAGDGDDLVFGDNDSDTIIGGDGDDTLSGGGAQDTILGQQGDDVLNGNGGSDLGALGEGNVLNTVPLNIEVIDETFTLSDEMLENLDGV